MALDVVAVHDIFLGVVLRASTLVPASSSSSSSSSSSHQQHSQHHQQCRLPLLGRDELELEGSFLGVEKGRRLRNVREFAAALGGSTSSTPGL